MTPSTVYRGRFAPSPTGPLHFGSLLAALASYCDARRAGGEWALRIEDVDGDRTQAGAIDNITATLIRYGFRWDSEAPHQSTRSVRYQTILNQLIARGEAFPCTCSRLQLQSAPLGASGERVYPGHCRPRLPVITPPLTAPPSAAAWRLRLPDTLAPVVFTDRVQGVQTQDLKHECGDFILKRRDGFYAYHLAAVVDDIDQGITHIVRGADLLTLTPRHLLLYSLLKQTPPSYLHIPVASTADGQKLSKQTRAPALPESPLPTLLAAWRFLAQPLPPRPPTSITAFWAWATAHWNADAVPAMTQQAAPNVTTAI